MKPSTKDEVAGKVHELKGKIKEKTGQVTNNPDLEDEGHDEKIGSLFGGPGRASLGDPETVEYGDFDKVHHQRKDNRPR
jgi:hypothetical protein